MTMNITELIPIPQNINQGLHSAKQRTMKKLIGNPRENYTQVCREPSNDAIRKMIVMDDAGPFSVRGLSFAVDSLKSIFAEIEVKYPEIYKVIGYAGMLCCRLIRGSSYAISNHSWGTAIDLMLAGKLDIRGDGKVQAGLATIAPIFNAHGWYWGAAFRTEDAMHFECSDELIRKWFKAKTQFVLSIGDRGPEVLELQKALSKFLDLDKDGVFGKETEKIVKHFQGDHGLVIDGIVGKKTWEKLKKN